MSLGLAWLLSPVDRDVFVETYWSKQALRVARKEAAYYEDLLPQKDLEFALLAAARTPGALEILSEEERPRPSRSHLRSIEAFRSGNSLRIDAVQRFSRPITALCRSLEQVISCPINVNMYLTPGAGKKALKRHYDTHDVFVLQVHGAKQWRIYDSQVAAPLEYLPLQRRESLRELRQFRLPNEQNGRDECSLVDDFLMEPGDCLYLPRGFWHEAESRPGEVSCHLTVGIQPMSYLDVLNCSLGDLALSEARLRQPLPFGFATDPSALATVTSHVSSLLSEIAHKLDPRAGFGEVTAHFLRTSRAGLETQLLQQFTSGPAHLDEKTKVRVNGGVVVGINAATLPPRLMFGDKVFAIESGYEEASYFAIRHEEFTVEELPGPLTLSQKIQFLGQLIAEGLLTAVNSSPPAEKMGGRRSLWYPTKIEPRDRLIRWMDFGTRSLNEPFFHQSVARYRRENPRAKVKTTPLGQYPPVENHEAPAGFIFHVSRCGSTLLSNAMRAIDSTVVISEPQPINALLSMAMSEDVNAQAQNEEPSLDLDEVLRSIVSAYGQSLERASRRLIVKFSSWNILCVERIRSLWPDVPCLMIIRDPVEVAVSCLEDPPGWMSWKANGDKANEMIGVSGEELLTMSDATFCSRVLEAFMEAALRQEGQWNILDYSQLNLGAMKQVSEIFGIDPSLSDLEAMEKSMTFYSKDPNASKAFESDGATKQSSISDPLREQIDLRVRSIYEQLRSRALPL